MDCATPAKYTIKGCRASENRTTLYGRCLRPGFERRTGGRHRTVYFCLPGDFDFTNPLVISGVTRLKRRAVLIADVFAVDVTLLSRQRGISAHSRSVAH
jgi:hypothetical protein